MKNKLARFVRKEWFPIIALFIAIYSLLPRDNDPDQETYMKGDISVAIIARAEPMKEMSDAFERSRWSRYQNRKGIPCYRFDLIRDQEVYLVLGGLERKNVLMFSRNPEEILDWLRSVEDMKCNTKEM